MTEQQLTRYSAIFAAELGSCRTLFPGTGGAGVLIPVAYHLAAAGVGKLGLADNDRVELSNLQRQYCISPVIRQFKG